MLLFYYGNLCILHDVCDYSHFWSWEFSFHEILLKYSCVILSHFNYHTYACILLNSSPSREAYSIGIVGIYPIGKEFEILVFWLLILWLGVLNGDSITW
jgi:hypothetical protein